MKCPTLLPPDEIQRRIYHVRGHRVMLDTDVACVFGTTAARLRHAIEGHFAYFPGDFAFPLVREEVCALISDDEFLRLGRGGAGDVWAFTQQGVAVAAAVLRRPCPGAVLVVLFRSLAAGPVAPLAATMQSARIYQ